MVQWLCRAGAEAQSWCRGAEVAVQTRYRTGVQRCRGAEIRDAQVHRCRAAEL